MVRLMSMVWSERPQAVMYCRCYHQLAYVRWLKGTTVNFLASTPTLSSLGRCLHGDQTRLAMQQIIAIKMLTIASIASVGNLVLNASEVSWPVALVGRAKQA